MPVSQPPKGPPSKEYKEGWDAIFKKKPKPKEDDEKE